MDDTQPLIEHLIELRSRLIRTLIGLLLCFVALVPFSEQLYTFVAQPLMSSLPAGNQMIATDVIAPFFVPMKVTLMLAFLASLPNTLWQVWAFVAPALYQNEKKLVLPLVVSTLRTASIASSSPASSRLRWITPARAPGRAKDRRSLVYLVIGNRPGALLHVLAPFDASEINLTFIQSRPLPGRPWEYGFFIEAATDWQSVRAQAAWKMVLALAESGRKIGTYPVA